MNKSRLIWGTICLLIAGGLAVANLSLPSENVMFQIGDQNMPWIPVVVLALLGIVLLATSGRPIQPGSGSLLKSAKLLTRIGRRSTNAWKEWPGACS